jgi:hypothetical protein
LTRRKIPTESVSYPAAAGVALLADLSCSTVMDDDTVAGTARQMRAVLDAIERGDLVASATVKARLEGAVVALEMLESNQP